MNVAQWIRRFFRDLALAGFQDALESLGASKPTDSPSEAARMLLERAQEQERALPNGRKVSRAV